MKKRFAFVFLTGALLAVFCLYAFGQKKPQNGYVPDEKTAVAIGVAVLEAITEKEALEKEKPFKARLEKGVWTVYGTLPEGFDGGTFEVQISKDDGRVLRHYRSQ